MSVKGMSATGSIQQTRKGPLRLKGKVTACIDGDEGGRIFDGKHHFEMHLFDIVNNKIPEVGEEVEFTPQINSDVYIARRISLDPDHQSCDFRSPPQESSEVSSVVPHPPSELASIKRHEEAHRHEIKQNLQEHRDCPKCRKPVVPRKVRGGLIPGLQREARVCPFCHTSLDKPLLSNGILWLLIIGLVLAAYYYSP